VLGNLGVTRAGYRDSVFASLTPALYQGRILAELGSDREWDGAGGDIAPYMAARAYRLRITVVHDDGRVQEFTTDGDHHVTLVHSPGHWDATLPARLPAPRHAGAGGRGEGPAGLPPVTARGPALGAAGAGRGTGIGEEELKELGRLAGLLAGQARDAAGGPEGRRAATAGTALELGRRLAVIENREAAGADRSLARNLQAAVHQFAYTGTVNDLPESAVTLREEDEPVAVSAWLQNLRLGVAQPGWAARVLDPLGMRWETRAAADRDIDEETLAKLEGLARTLAAAPREPRRGPGAGAVKDLDTALVGISDVPGLKKPDRDTVLNLRALVGYYGLHGNLNVPQKIKLPVPGGSTGEKPELAAGMWLYNRRTRTRHPGWAARVLGPLGVELGTVPGGGGAAGPRGQGAGPRRGGAAGGRARTGLGVRGVQFSSAGTALGQDWRLAGFYDRGAAQRPLGDEEYRVVGASLLENRLVYRPESDQVFPWRDHADPVGKVYQRFGDAAGRLHPAVGLRKEKSVPFGVKMLGASKDRVRAMGQGGEPRAALRADADTVIMKLEQDVGSLVQAAIDRERGAPGAGGLAAADGGPDPGRERAAGTRAGAGPAVRRVPGRGEPDRPAWGAAAAVGRPGAGPLPGGGPRQRPGGR
jgi:hypothetical protein